MWHVTMKTKPILKRFAIKYQVALGPNNRTTKSRLIAITVGINRAISRGLFLWFTVLTYYICRSQGMHQAL